MIRCLPKFLVKDKNRAGAIKKLAECLGQTEIFGVEKQPCLSSIFSSPGRF